MVQKSKIYQLYTKVEINDCWMSYSVITTDILKLKITVVAHYHSHASFVSEIMRHQTVASLTANWRLPILS